MQPLYEFGGQGAVIHLAVANGFPPGTYAPLLKPMTDHYRVVSLPPRALWSDEQPPEDLRGWQMIADDMLAGMEQYGLRDVIAVGHSFGAIASILAALAEPERFRALVLLDPTILPDSAMAYMAYLQTNGEIEEFPPVRGALNRKQMWSSLDEAYEYFRGKPLFSDWPDDYVRLYAEEGTRPADGGVELAWPAAWEAYYFSTVYTQTWDILPQIKHPLLMVRGGVSETFSAESLARARDILPGATYAEVPGHGHLFPQSTPDETRRIIDDWLAG